MRYKSKTKSLLVCKLHPFLCFTRNLSSVNERTRQQMRETRGLVDSLVGYIQNSLDEGKVDDKVRKKNLSHICYKTIVLIQEQ